MAGVLASIDLFIPGHFCAAKEKKIKFVIQRYCGIEPCTHMVSLRRIDLAWLRRFLYSCTPVYRISGFFLDLRIPTTDQLYLYAILEQGPSAFPFDHFLFTVYPFQPDFLCPHDHSGFRDPALAAFTLLWPRRNVMDAAATAGRSQKNSSGLLIRDTVGNNGSLMLLLAWIWQLTPAFACIAFIEARRKYRLASWFCILLGIICCIRFFFWVAPGAQWCFVAAAPCFFLVIIGTEGN